MLGPVDVDQCLVLSVSWPGSRRGGGGGEGCWQNSPRGCSYELSCVPTDASSPFPESLLVLLVLLLLKFVKSRFPITISCHIPGKRRREEKRERRFKVEVRFRGQKLWRGMKEGRSDIATTTGRAKLGGQRSVTCRIGLIQCKEEEEPNRAKHSRIRGLLTGLKGLRGTVRDCEGPVWECGRWAARGKTDEPGPREQPAEGRSRQSAALLASSWPFSCPLASLLASLLSSWPSCQPVALFFRHVAKMDHARCVMPNLHRHASAVTSMAAMPSRSPPADLLSQT